MILGNTHLLKQPRQRLLLFLAQQRKGPSIRLGSASTDTTTVANPRLVEFGADESVKHALSA